MLVCFRGVETVCNMHLKLFLFLMIAFPVVMGYDCPPAAAISPCVCMGYSTPGVDVYCSDAANQDEIANAFQASFPVTNMRAFIIQDNSDITELTYNVFGDYSFYEVYIQNTNIETIDASFFDNLNSRLSYLIMKQNKLTQFDLSVLNNMDVIDNVDLTENNLTHIPKLSSSTLGYLTLPNNSIATIEDSAFEDLSAIWKLDLHGNQINSITNRKLLGISYSYNMKIKYNFIFKKHLPTCPI